MIRIALGIFVVLHGLVHLLYFGQSSRIFEMQPGMTWPDGAWVFSKLFGDESTRTLASILLIIAVLSFIIGGAGIFFKQEWWRMVVALAAAFSVVIYFLLWNGRFTNLANNGWVGIIINMIILVVLYCFRWPKF